MGRLFQKTPFFFAVALLFFAAIQLIGRIPDPDTFYHAKMAVFLSRGEIVRDFVWLPFTTWADRFADPHFGYHLLLVPFVKIFDPLVGIRVAQVLFAALAITAVVWIVKRTTGDLKVAPTLLVGLVLFLTGPFVFRMSLAKAPAISLLFLLAIWYATIWSSERELALDRTRTYVRYSIISLLVFLYVWLYNGWPLLFVAVAAVAIARRTVRPLLYATLGALAGIIINPYFPANLQFMWDFIVRSGIGASHRLVQIGGEWSAMKPWELAAGTPWAHLLLLIVLIPLLNPPPSPKGEERWWGMSSVPFRSAALLTIFFYFATLYARRNVEYFVPFAVIAGALATASLFHDREKVMQGVGRLIRRSVIVPTTLLVVAAAIIARDSVVIYETYRGGYRPERLRDAAAWIKTNVPPGEIIMHSNWSEFPMLFYYDDTHRYISGLDPTFFFFKDPARYRAWEDLRNGHITAGTAAMIRDRFDAHYVLVTVHNDKMQEALEADPAFDLAYQDEEANVFRLSY